MADDYKSRALITADVVLFYRDTPTNKLYILLVRRKEDPFRLKWCLPGGLMEMDELVDTASRRQLKDQTGVALSKLDLYFFKFFDSIYRSTTNSRTISFCYTGITTDRAMTERLAPGDDVIDCKFLPINEIPQLAFDHNSIVEAAFDYTKKNFTERVFTLDWPTRFEKMRKYSGMKTKVKI